MATAFNPDGVWAPFGPFSQMAIAGEGQVIHLKGQVSLDRDGAIVRPGDMREQIRQVLKNIEALLASVNGRIGDIVSLTQYTTDIAAFMDAGDVRKSYFRAPYPVTTTIGVAALYHPDLVVEITAVAEIPTSRFKRPDGAAPMHG